MTFKKFRVGDIDIYRVAGTFYIGIHPEAPYEQPGIRFTIVAPPTRSASAPQNQWRQEVWRSVRRRRKDGQPAVELELLKTTPLSDDQIQFFARYRGGKQP